MTYYTAQTADFSAGAAFDYRGLERLRRGVSGAHANEAAKQEVAQQFEALFLQMMLKRMREATPRDGLFDSDQTRMVQSLADEQLSTQLAKPGIGLAQALLKQIEIRQNPMAMADEADEEAGVSVPNPASDPTPDSSFGPASAHLPRAHAFAVADGPTADGVAGRAQRFLAKMSAAARHAAARIGVPTPLVLAQAALESGWGAREIRHPDGRPSHNLFGIKAGGDWHGEVVQVMTTEYKNGVAYKVEQPFRAYRSYSESFADYARLIASNPRYQPVREAANAHEAARRLQSCGYASDPNYADKLIDVMSSLPGSSERADKFIVPAR